MFLRPPRTFRNTGFEHLRYRHPRSVVPGGGCPQVWRSGHMHKCYTNDAAFMFFMYLSVYRPAYDVGVAWGGGWGSTDEVDSEGST